MPWFLGWHHVARLGVRATPRAAQHCSLARTERQGPGFTHEVGRPQGLPWRHLQSQVKEATAQANVPDLLGSLAILQHHLLRQAVTTRHRQRATKRRGWRGPGSHMWTQPCGGLDPERGAAAPLSSVSPSLEVLAVPRLDRPCPQVLPAGDKPGEALACSGSACPASLVWEQLGEVPGRQKQARGPCEQVCRPEAKSLGQMRAASWRRPVGTRSAAQARLPCSTVRSGLLVRFPWRPWAARARVPGGAGPRSSVPVRGPRPAPSGPLRRARHSAPLDPGLLPSPGPRGREHRSWSGCPRARRPAATCPRAELTA